MSCLKKIHRQVAKGKGHAMAEYVLLLGALATVSFAAYLSLGAGVGKVLNLSSQTAGSASVSGGGGVIGGRIPNDGRAGSE
jgi:hypothetical protein